MVWGPGQMGLRRGAEPGPMCPASCASPAHVSPAKFELYQEKGSVQKIYPSLHICIFYFGVSLPFFSPQLPRKVLAINSNFTSVELQCLLNPISPLAMALSLTNKILQISLPFASTAPQCIQSSTLQSGSGLLCHILKVTME